MAKPLTPTRPPKVISGLETGSPASGRGQNALLQDLRTANPSDNLLTALQAVPTDLQRVRVLARLSGDASHAVWSMIRLAKTPLTITAYDRMNQVSPEGMAYMDAVTNALFTAQDYTQGYSTKLSLDSLIETLLKEVPLTGATSLELVLDRNRLPSYLNPVSPSTIKWRTGTQQVNAPSAPVPAYKIVPYQTVQGQYIILDIPNFFYSSLDQDPTTPYSTPVLETNILPALQYENIITDIQRVVRMTGHSRLLIKLVFEKMRDSMPLDIKQDPTKWEGWFEAQRLQVEDTIKKLSPEQGFAMYDTAEATYLNSEIGAGADYSPLLETLDGRQAASLKTPPSVLSKRMSAGSQNTTSTEALLYLKTAEAIQAPVASVLQQAFTLCLRLFGFDGYAKVSFAKPSLRPDVELAAFRSMDQTSILDLLSLGFLTDEEAAQRLGTGPRAPGAPPLSGTMFRDTAGSTNSLADPTSNADPIKRAVTGNLPASTPATK